MFRSCRNCDSSDILQEYLRRILLGLGLIKLRSLRSNEQQFVIFICNSNAVNIVKVCVMGT